MAIRNSKFAAFLKSTTGAGLVEYGMLVGLVSVLSIGAVVGLGERVDGVFAMTKSTLASEVSATASGGAQSAGGGNVVGSQPDGSVDYEFLIAAEAYGTSTGYYDGGGSSAFGSHTVTTDGLGSGGVRSLITTANPVLILRIYDVTVAQVQNHTLYCEGVGTWAIADAASANSYTSYNDIRWDILPEEIMTGGETYECGLVDTSL